MTPEIEAISAPTDDLIALLSRALVELQDHRGGVSLAREIAAAVGVDELADVAERLAAAQRLLTATLEGSLVGVLALSLTSPVTILGLFVDRSARRQHVGRALVTHAFARADAPQDAWVLPGDRASKSLYEQAGWKARRLTMSAGSA